MRHRRISKQFNNSTKIQWMEIVWEFQLWANSFNRAGRLQTQLQMLIQRQSGCLLSITLKLFPQVNLYVPDSNIHIPTCYRYCSLATFSFPHAASSVCATKYTKMEYAFTNCMFMAFSLTMKKTILSKVYVRNKTTSSVE